MHLHKLWLLLQQEAPLPWSGTELAWFSDLNWQSKLHDPLIWLLDRLYGRDKVRSRCDGDKFQFVHSGRHLYEELLYLLRFLTVNSLDGSDIKPSNNHTPNGHLQNSWHCIYFCLRPRSPWRYRNLPLKKEMLLAENLRRSCKPRWTNWTESFAAFIWSEHMILISNF